MPKQTKQRVKTLLTALGWLMIVSIVVLGGCCVWKKYKYPETIEDLKIQRATFIEAYNRASSPQEKEACYKEIRSYLQTVITENVLPAWYGTPWSFNGDAEGPLDGTVACGYFVVNVLRNCHFNIDSKMAMQPSENIIKNLVQTDNIKRFSNISIGTLKQHIRTMGDGLYIIGLDSHVGFILNTHHKIRFTHSHGYLFVLSEYPNFSPTLRRSGYIVIGKLFDDGMIEKWLHDEKFALTHDYFQK